MPLLDHAQAVVEDVGFALDQMIGRQAAGTLADAHRAARRMEAHAQFDRGRDLVVEARAVGEHVQVIGDGRRSTEQQLGEPDFGADVDRLGVHPSPDRIQRLEPVEQRQTARRAHAARQRLVQVVMAVDQPWNQHAAAQVDDAIRRAAAAVGGYPRVQVGAAADAFDPLVADEHRAVGDFGAGVVLRGQHVGMGQQQLHRGYSVDRL